MDGIVKPKERGQIGVSEAHEEPHGESGSAVESDGDQPAIDLVIREQSLAPGVDERTAEKLTTFEVLPIYRYGPSIEGLPLHNFNLRLVRGEVSFLAHPGKIQPGEK